MRPSLCLKNYVADDNQVIIQRKIICCFGGSKGRSTVAERLSGEV